jgi:hypothetical protein
MRTRTPGAVFTARQVRQGFEARQDVSSRQARQGAKLAKLFIQQAREAIFFINRLGVLGSLASLAGGNVLASFRPFARLPGSLEA